MDSSSVRLLKMLEPAIRPEGTVSGGSSAACGRRPIEQQSFDEILQQAHEVQEKLDLLQQMTTGSQQQTSAKSESQDSSRTPEADGSPVGAMGSGAGRKGSGGIGGGMGGLQGVENASLVRLLGQAGQKE